MLIKVSDTRSEDKLNMRGGEGSVNFRYLLNPEKVTSNVSMCAEITIPVGCSIGYHEHITNDEVYYIVSGRGTVTDEKGIDTEVGAGDVVFTGNGQAHSIKCVGEEAVKMFAIIVNY